VKDEADMSQSTPALSEHTLGQPLDDPQLARTLAALDPSIAWKEDEGLSHWVSLPAGVDLQGNSEHNRVTTVFFFNEGIEDHEQYAGPLPRGLEFTWDRARIAKHLGAPGLSGPEHECWVADDHRLVVEYDDDGVIASVTVTTM
jgi:hypothetical protein